MSGSAPIPNTAIAIACKLGAVLFFMGMATLIKIASAGVPPGETVFFRSIFGLPLILCWIWLNGELNTGLKVSKPITHIWLGLAGVSAMFMGFAALGLLPLSEVKAIQYVHPVLVVFFAAMFLGERLRFYRITAVALGMTGVLIVMSPRLTAFSDAGVSSSLTIGAVLAFGSAVMIAVAHVIVRKLTKTEPTSAIVFWFAVSASVLSLATLPFGWAWPSGTVAAALVGAGILGGIGQIFLTSSYRFADASVVAPFEYFSIVLALTFGYFVFSEIPTTTMLIGIVLIVCAGALIIWREKISSEDRDQNRSSTPS